MYLLTSDRPVSSTGVLVALSKLGRGLLIFACLYGLAWLRGTAPLWAYVVIPVVTVPCLYLALGRGSRFHWLAFYIVGVALFAQVRTIADETGMFIHVAYPIHVDSLLLGVTPTEWLQDRFYDAARVSALDYLTTFIYTSYFISMPVAAFALIMWAPKHFPRFSAAMIATMSIGLAVYFLVPTTPPWLAAEQGAIGDVARVVKITSAVLHDGLYANSERVVGTNEVAAMPSLHLAISLVMALVFGSIHKQWRYVILLYPVAMAFTLMYTGEHYFIDIVGGTATALIAWKVAGRVAATKQSRLTVVHRDVREPSEELRKAA